MPPTVYRIATIVALCIAGGLAIASAAQDSQTHDEVVHLTAGYSYWKTGDFRLSPEHPPLAKLVATLPLLLWLKPKFEPNAEQWGRAEDWAISKTFLYDNHVPADHMLMAARTVSILFGLVLAATLAWWVTRQAGPAAGFTAALLFAFEPTVLAHSRYVTTDIPVTLFVWLACVSLHSYMKTGGRWPLIRTGILLGLACATKFNALFLPLVLLLMWAVYRKPTWRAGMAMMGIALMVILVTYGFDTQSAMQDPVAARQIEEGRPGGIVRAVTNLPIPGYYFLRGLHLMIRHQAGGHVTYFMGETSREGSWMYFPVALLVKSSLAWLALLFLAIGIAVLKKGFWKERRELLLPILLPAAAYFVFALVSPINIGLRHLLPMYPFVCAFAAIVLFSGKRSVLLRTASSLLLVVFLMESATAYPNYVAYFNAAAGGPANGHRFLLDSNLDWGQDLKRLARYTETHDVQPLCLAYFGTADPNYYGIRHTPLPPLRTADDLKTVDCVAAVSLQYLYGIEEHLLKALETRPPTDRVGASIYVYDLRLPKQSSPGHVLWRQLH
jgi:hypothetical protein